MGLSTGARPRRTAAIGSTADARRIRRGHARVGRGRDSLPGAVEGEVVVVNYTLTVNGRQTEVDVDPGTPLLWVLREHLKLTGTKYGCGIGACGACTVHVAGVATRSCLLPISLVGNRPIATIETMASDPVGRLVQDAWVATDVVQCGYCQSGQIMTAVALLKAVPKPTDAQVEQGMGGNICRCGTYVRIRQAITRAAQQLG